MGGGQGAARAMGPSRQTATGLGQFFGDVSQRGPVDALRTFSLESLAGAAAVDVFVALADVLCPDGGTIDDAIARNAMLETAAAMGANGDTPFDALPAAALDAFFLGTISRSIEAKLFNEIGGKGIRLPTDVAAVRAIQQTLHDFIEGTVRDRFTASGRTLASIPRGDVEGFVRAIYEQSSDLIRTLGDAA